MTTTPIPAGPVRPSNTGPNKLLIALIAVGGVLLLAVVAIVFLLIGQNSAQNASTAGSPSPSITESNTPSSEPSDTAAPPVDNSTRFTSFDYDPNVQCDTTGQADEKPSPSISWQSAHAQTVYWTPSDSDPRPEANADNGYKVPSSGNQDDMSASKGAGERFEFPCNHRQYLYVTFTLTGPDGHKVSKTAKFTDVNWNSGDDSDN